MSSKPFSFDFTHYYEKNNSNFLILKSFKVSKIYTIRYFENLSLWQRLNSFIKLEMQNVLALSLAVQFNELELKKYFNLTWNLLLYHMTKDSYI